MSTVVTFGEVMTRFRTPGNRRFRQSFPGSLEVSFAGAEANVAAGLAILGDTARFVTALPDDPVSDACVAFFRGLGVDTTEIVRTGTGRIGSYYLEMGASQRPTNVVYDRDYSALALHGPEIYDWDRVFADADWFHVTGITPALSRRAAEAMLAAVRRAREKGLVVSCDLNFRGKLWRWDPDRGARELARHTMEQILPSVDLLIANEGDAEDVLGIRAGSTDVSGGDLEVSRYPDVARQIVSRFSNVTTVAITLRESVSASHNRWGAMIYDTATDAAAFAPQSGGAYKPYEITHIVDRVGGGDSFAAALIYALRAPDLRGDIQVVLSFAAAASTLCHSIEGDINLVTREEIEAVARGVTSGRVTR